jgi:glycine cleavage system H protein
MSEVLTFAMGKYEARFPTDRMYSENHHWLQEAPGGFRVGLTAFSVRLLQDVYFLEWSIDPHTPVRRKQEIGEIESSKAVSALYAPVEGKLLEFNDLLLEDPTPINSDSYDTGWLYSIATEAKLLTPRQYIEVLATGWDDTQRMIKGQMN